MIRKQLYITEEQDRALKERARALGLSEAALVRRALDELLEASGEAFRSGRRETLDRLVERTRRLAESRRLPEGHRFSREELYAGRGRRKAAGASEDRGKSQASV